MDKKYLVITLLIILGFSVLIRMNIENNFLEREEEETISTDTMKDYAEKRNNTKVHELLSEHFTPEYMIPFQRIEDQVKFIFKNKSENKIRIAGFYFTYYKNDTEIISALHESDKLSMLIEEFPLKNYKSYFQVKNITGIKNNGTYNITIDNSSSIIIYRYKKEGLYEALLE